MSVLNEIRSHRIRTVKTLALYMTFFALGLSNGIIGPTLLDLQLAVSTTVDQITLILPVRSGGYALGSVICGLVITLINPQLLFIGCFLVSTVMMAFIPWSRSLGALMGFLFVNGLSMGAVDAGGVIWLLHLWGKENPPFMQALHFCFGLGAFVAPLIAKPYLLPLQVEESTENVTLVRNNVVTLESTTNETDFSGYSPDDVELKYPYGMISIYFAVVIVIFTIVYCIQKQTKPHPSRVVDETKTVQINNIMVERVVIVCATLFMHVYCGLEIAFGTLLTTYAVKSDLRLDKATGALMTSCFWGTFTFFRLFAVVYVDFIGPEKNLYFALFLVLFSNVFLAPFGNTYVWALWAGVALMGLGTSSIYATVFGFLENYFPVSGRVAAGFAVAACLGEFILPFLMGNFIDTFPAIFLYISLVCSVSCCILFIITAYLCKNYLVKKVNVSV